MVNALAYLLIDRVRIPSMPYILLTKASKKEATVGRYIEQYTKFPQKSYSAFAKKAIFRRSSGSPENIANVFR